MKGFYALTLAAVLGYAGSALAAIQWQEGGARNRSCGSSDVVETAQFYCAYLTEKGHKDWRLPTEQELKSMLRSDTPHGMFWSANSKTVVLSNQKVAVFKADRVQKANVRCVRFSR